MERKGSVTVAKARVEKRGRREGVGSFFLQYYIIDVGQSPALKGGKGVQCLVTSEPARHVVERRVG